MKREGGKPIVASGAVFRWQASFRVARGAWERDVKDKRTFGIWVV